jgi:hypothetical protein
MKKLLSLTLALAFGVTCNAYAATATASNPFDDIPQNHWAYGAASQLAKDGLIEGYGDKSFRGDKPISRYEMAVIVAKAMSKSSKSTTMSPETKAALSKLEGEFSSELDKLGVRLKAVESKVGNVKFDGELESFYQQRGVTKFFDQHAGWGSQSDNTMTTTELKLRAHMQVGDDFTVHTEIVGGHNYRDGSSFVNGNNTDGGSMPPFGTQTYNTKDTFMKLYWEGPILGVNTYFGRFDPKEKDGFNQYFDPMFWDVGLFDGAKFEFGNKLKTTLFTGKANNSCNEFIDNANVKYNALRFDTQLNDFNLWLMYHDVATTSNSDKANLLNSWGKDTATAYEFHVGTPIKLPIPGKWYTWSNIIATNAPTENHGYHVGLSYNDPPDRKTPGQWGMWTMFHKQESNSALNPFGEAKSWEIEWGQAHKGFQGWEVGLNYVPFVNQRIMVREIFGKPAEDFFIHGAKMGNENAFRIEWDMDF